VCVCVCVCVLMSQHPLLGFTLVWSLSHAAAYDNAARRARLDLELSQVRAMRVGLELAPTVCRLTRCRADGSGPPRDGTLPRAGRQGKDHHCHRGPPPQEGWRRRGAGSRARAHHPPAHAPRCRLNECASARPERLRWAGTVGCRMLACSIMIPGSCKPSICGLTDAASCCLALARRAAVASAKPVCSAGRCGAVFVHFVCTRHD
jgi:hypothetical protein